MQGPAASVCCVFEWSLVPGTSEVHAHLQEVIAGARRVVKMSVHDLLMPDTHPEYERQLEMIKKQACFLLRCRL